ncbi:MAG: hypothetical protein RL653_1457 [Pseudomonadota bacterium]
MARGAVMAATLGILGCSHALPVRAALQVDVLEDDVARVVDLDTGRAGTVARGALPVGAREGDVVVNGAVDPVLTEAMAREIRALHARYGVPVPRGLDLAAEPPLTGDPE